MYKLVLEPKRSDDQRYELWFYYDTPLAAALEEAEETVPYAPHSFFIPLNVRFRTFTETFPDDQ